MSIRILISLLAVSLCAMPLSADVEDTIDLTQQVKKLDRRIVAAGAVTYLSALVGVFIVGIKSLLFRPRDRLSRAINEYSSHLICVFSLVGMSGLAITGIGVVGT